MKKFSNRILLLIPVVFVMIIPELRAQKKSTGLELGAGLGLFVYQGDLTPQRLGSFRTMKPGIVLSAAHIMSPSFAVRLNFSAGSLKGDEAKYNNPEYRKFRAFAFKSPLVEIAPQLVWNPLGKNDAEKSLSPYLFAGAGISFQNIKRDYSRFDAAYFGDGSIIPQGIAADEQKRLPKIRMVIPLGAGLRYNLSHSFALNTEVSYRLLNTDYLDGFSIAANPERNDHYQSISAGIIYRMGNHKKSKNGLGCPVLKQ
jgi:hypothetical protein